MQKLFVKKKIKVLMITGVYFPEKNGAVLQCMQLIRNVGGLVDFVIFAGANNLESEGDCCVEGVAVTKIFISRRSRSKYIFDIIRFYVCAMRKIKKVDLVHLHGFSRRNAIVVLLGRVLGKKIVLKMSSYGHDDPSSIKQFFPHFWWIFKCCHTYISLSPAFAMAYQKERLPESKYSFIPNGVDLVRFSPVSLDEKKILKLKYGFGGYESLLIFVGHFSPEKRPMIVYKAWIKLLQMNCNVGIIFIGRTTKNYYEVDEEIYDAIRADAQQRGVLSLISFIEETSHIDDYMKMADIFVLPSVREGMPNALLEAMACALTCVARRLPGVTDWLIDDGRTGLLVQSDDPDVWAQKIRPYVENHLAQRQMGLAARQFIADNFSCVTMSRKMVDLYRRTTG